MTRLATLVVAVLAVVGCEKPSEDSCRKAIANMKRLMGTENLRDIEGVESEVRRCKGGSSRKAVDCAVKAQTLDELRSCEFFKVPANAPGIGSEGSAAPAPAAAPTGSAAATGSAPAAAGTGSAEPSGSAAP